MIQAYRFGKPIETDAVLVKPNFSEGKPTTLTFDENKITYTMSKDTICYGLGENVRGMNKRGWIYTSNCSDDPNHTEEKQSLYGAHNFILLASEDEKFGVFIDTPAKVVFDVGYTVYDKLTISVEENAYDLYFITGKSCDEIVTQFRGLIGKSYIPPRWAFGFGQCRWSYMSSDEVRAVARSYRENDIPIDMIYLDIDYMERYKDFTVNPETFGDFDQLVADMKEQGIRLVPIIDGGVKVEEGYPTYEEGIEKGYFCKDEDGKEFIVGVWPGKCCLPDMLNEEAGRWFGSGYKFLIDKGIEGFWNDMNEPALFYSEKRLQKILKKIEDYQGKNLDINSFFALKEDVVSIANNPEDYSSFYHNYKGERIRHDKVHNLFGYNMTRYAGEELERMVPDRRTLLFSRASYIGMHRYGGIWMGDNQSWWSHLLMNLKMMPSLNMCGFLYSGADLAGFSSNTTEDLALRWHALGIFEPLMRNHSAMGTRRQELYNFGNTKAFSGILKLRYRLLPYIYSEFVKAALNNTMYARPLGFVWENDTIARHVEDQLMIGESIMIAPVYEQNAIGRTVYLPEDMKLVRFHGEELVEEKILPAGHHFVEVDLEEVVFFIRKGHILPLAKAGKNADNTKGEDLMLLDYAQTGATYELYEDDGLTRDVHLDGRIRTLRK